MLRDVAITRIQNGLGFRTDRAAEIALRLQEAQRDLEKGKTLPKSLLVTGNVLSLISGDNYVNLPADFLRRAGNFTYTLAASEVPRFVTWKGHQDAIESYWDEDLSSPQVAVLEPTLIRFYPGANENISLTWNYYKRAAILTTNIENEWLEEEQGIPEWLIGEAGYRMAFDTRDQHAMTLFDNMRKTARASLFSDIVLQEDNEEQLVMGANL